MPSCLGIYTENNIIKYAKISKEHENIKVESFGIKFYDNMDEAIKQIVNETYSFKVPISINTSDEKYTYADLFSLLNKKDLEAAIDTEFDYFCNENGKNRNAMQYRKLILQNTEDKDKVRVLYAYTDKANLINKLQTFNNLNLSNISPLPISITNLTRIKERKNSVIVNIEKETTITMIINGELYKIETFDLGMKEILDNISLKENSYAKAYEICKNSTIYTLEGKSLQTEENDYMEDIMPTLYKIIQKVEETIKNNFVNIDNIYITGSATVINNIDLYFQENFINQKCEILVPYFATKTNLKLNIKDYIEVNSAIALALQGLGEGAKNINFKNESVFNQISKALNIQMGGKSKKDNRPKQNNKDTQSTPQISIKNDFSSSLNKLEKDLIRVGSGILILIICYMVFESVISNQIENKQKDADIVISDTNAQVNNVNTDQKDIKNRTDYYESLISQMQSSSEKLTQKYASKNAIPNLLNNIMFAIPKQVQILSIQNTKGKHIIIVAQAEKYEQLGYFKAKLKTDSLLTDVTSTSGTKENNLVKVTIEGDLPY